MKFLKWLISFTSRSANIIAVLFLLLCFVASYINPNSFALAPFLSLLFPIALIINILFIIIWKFRKRKFIWVSILAILLSVIQWKNFFAIHCFGNSEKNNVESIKIMSFNVRVFDLYNWTENKNSVNHIFETIKTENPDVICFQEFYTDKTENFNTVQRLKKLGYQHYYFTRELVSHETNEWGIATFSKMPIVDKGLLLKQQFASAYNKKPYKGLYVDILLNNKKVRIFNIHLQSIYFGQQDYQSIDELRKEQAIDKREILTIARKLNTGYKRRAIQANELNSFLKEQSLPFVMCGDFNDVPNSYAVNKIKGNLQDAFLQKGCGLGITYNGKIPLLRIDYILANDKINFINYKKINNKNSDHFPITARFSIN
ncbi:MAG: endonuclease/exonuclease/phosphatase family protein [Chitinophagales bacterium]|nr:endonuclease/exonuclease/phosphatase family protein [Chitinophagales bacterium]